MSAPLLGYVPRQGWLHTLTGVSKLVLVIALVVGAMISFDARYLLGLSVLSTVLWGVSRVRLRDLAVVLWLIAMFMVLNNLLIFLFAPEYGPQLFDSRTLLLDGPWRWDLTVEQLFYQLVVTLKYFAVLPGVLLFITTTRPPEFASSLSRIGVPYRAAYAVSLALRYIPDVQRDFRTISQAQQARGLEVTRRVGLGTRMRNLTSTLMPLLLGAFDRIESVAAAMELRGFGRGRGRTWYDQRPLRTRDVLVMIGSLLVLTASIALVVLGNGRWWNPFG